MAKKDYISEKSIEVGRVLKAIRIKRNMSLRDVEKLTGISNPYISQQCKFYRISSKGNQEERGSGLGLAIVKSIAERHGGDVHVESQLGVGSTFYLVIPMKQAKSESPPY